MGWAKQMPFEDRSGILVLSHTNKAVEEIEKKLKNHCPQLFEYPNFVGTIQSFVDVFLAFPYYTNYKKEKIHSVSDEFYLSAVSTYIKKFRNGSEAYIKNKNPNLFHSARYWFDDNNEKILAAGLTNKPLSFCPPNTWVNDGTDTEKISAVIGSIKEMKKKFLLLHPVMVVEIFNKCIEITTIEVLKVPPKISWWENWGNLEIWTCERAL